jgi:hypothetical protein
MSIECVQQKEDQVPDLHEALEEEKIRRNFPSESEHPLSTMSITGSVLPSTSGSNSDSGVRLLENDNPSGWERAPSPTSTEHSSVLGSARSTNVTPTNGRGAWTKQPAFKDDARTRIKNQQQRQELNTPVDACDDDSASDGSFEL